MTTNILATIAVCIVTNVTAWDNEVREPFTDSYFVGAPAGGSVLEPATQKTETTEVIEIKTLRFMWEGETYTGKHRRVLSRNVRRWRKKETWLEVKD